jgi:hypothetical protein
MHAESNNSHYLPSESRCRKAVALVVCCLAMVAAPQCRADMAALDFTAVTGGFVDGVPRVIGWEFTTGPRPLLVKQLGVFDFNGDGLLTSHDIAIYNDQTEAAVVTATVPSGTSAALDGLFRNVSVSPTILQANTGYVIAASWVENADPQVWAPSIGSPSADIVNLTVDPAITLGITASGQPPSARFVDFDATLQFPYKRIGDVYPGDPRTVFVGPNFTFDYAPTPEPSSVLLAGLGTLGVLTMGRRLVGAKCAPRAPEIALGSKS